MKGKGWEMRVFPSNLSNFGESRTLTKNTNQILLIPSSPNSFPHILLSKQEIRSPSKFLPFLSLHVLPSKHALKLSNTSRILLCSEHPYQTNNLFIMRRIHQLLVEVFLCLRNRNMKDRLNYYRTAFWRNHRV